MTLIGGFLYPAVVGAMASLLSSLNGAYQQFNLRLKRLNHFMSQAGFGQGLRTKINRFYNYLWSRQRGVDEEKILDDLPVTLKMAVQDAVNGRILRSVSFFEAINPDFVRHLLAVLKPTVFLPNDVIIRADEVNGAIPEYSLRFLAWS